MKDIPRFLQAKRMWEIFSVLLFLTLGRSRAEANSTDPILVTTLDSSKVEVSHPGSAVPEVQSLGGVEAISLIPDSSANPTSVLAIKQDGRDIKHSTFTTQEEIQSSPTPVTIQQGENISLKTPSREKDSDGSVTNAKTSILPKDGGHSAQIQPRKGPLEKETPKKPVVSRTSRQSGYGSNSGQQAKDNRSPSFDTTRGKNWCAYVHTRLQPTIVVDNVQSYSSGRAKPCTWITGSCGTSSQSRTHQVYRIKHMIVTSLEWKCCPGYSGGTCQPTAQQDQTLIHSNQAESNTATTGQTLGNQQQQQEPNDQVAQKVNEQISSQEMKLTLLQKKVDNISVIMRDVSQKLSSLEGKINEDKSQDFLKGFKSKGVTELIREIVKEQFKAFQSDMQETVAQIFKITSDLSEDLENTKGLVKGLNKSCQRFALDIENRPTRVEILDIRTQILHIEDDISFTCERPIKELQEKQRSLEADLEHQSSKSDIYYGSLNKTLTQMKEAHEQLLSVERSSVQNVPIAAESMNDNLTNFVTNLQEKMKTQNLMVLQLYDDLRIQDNKINNLTISLEIQRHDLQGRCDNILSECKSDIQLQIRGVEGDIRSLNKTVESLVFPLDDKMEKMNEQINDLCYDMEILQPLIEQGVPFSLSSEDELRLETDAISRKLENLTNLVTTLNFTIVELHKNQKELKTDAQTQDEISRTRIDECFVLVEEGLNKTMIVINSAIDSIQDNYVLKEALNAWKNETEACCDRGEKMENVLTLIPQFQKMNESLQILVSQNEKPKRIWPLVESSFGERDIHHLSKGHPNPNTTLLNVQEHKRDAGHPDDKILHSSNEYNDHEMRLQAVEGKIIKFLANNCVSVRNVKAAATENEKTVSVQLQTFNSRIRALEAKSIRLSLSIPLLNKTANEARNLCEDVSGTIREMNASLPKLMPTIHSDGILFQKGFQELTGAMIEAKTETLLANLTLYVDKSLEGAIDSITKRLKAAATLPKKPLPGKKTPMNSVTNQAGRSQRNTDSALETGDYLSCSSSPCQNGGTCINEKRGFVCACRYPFGGANCSAKMMQENAAAIDFSKGSYRYAPMVAFFASHTYGMNTPGPIRFNNLDVNYGTSYVPANGRFRVPYLGVYVFEYNIESSSPSISGYLVVDGTDKLTFRSENGSGDKYVTRVVTGDAILELNYGQEVWLRLAKGSIPAKYPPVTTFSGYLLYRT
ncbi:multimerin-1 isoform X2 [Pantherophis guttatus]|uniref:Multimerin-1 isoform X2 n=1 Tax=Pantherophis guttatus TaxID=94885 RepID=A0A6P9DKL3_PANGU|nr:multimerin-1 isoform X2 [Pantherophis guttatus]